MFLEQQMEMDPKSVGELIAEVREMKALLEKHMAERAEEMPLPPLCSLEVAAAAISGMSVKTLKQRIREGKILVNTDLGRWVVPSTEIRRLQKEARSLSKPRTSGGRPKKARFDPRSESQRLRAELKKR